MIHAERLLWTFLLMASLTQTTTAEKQTLYIGTSEAGAGISASTLDLETGAFTTPKEVGHAPRPGFLALHPKLPMLYTVAREEGQPSGGIRAFQIDSETHDLTPNSQESSGDENATHLVVDPLGRAVVVANYGGGSSSILPLNDTGELKPLTSLIKHEGSSVNPNRQGEPHAHGVAMDAAGKFACVADLGTDEVIVYRVTDDLKLERHSSWKANRGAGPRHLALHENGQWMYCINELDSTMVTLEFNDQAGTLTELQTISTLPPGYQEPSSTAEVVIHPSGKFVYGSNRGHDSTAAFAIDQQTGKLSLVEIEPTQGGHPRFIGIEPSGKYLIAANRDADNLVSFSIDPDTGSLQPTGHQARTPKPICVVFPR